MPLPYRPLAVLLAVAALASTALSQSRGNNPNADGISFAVTGDTLGSNLTSGNRFWMEGGAAELTGNFFHGLGATASLVGLHTADTSGGVPLNLVLATFGPSYRYTGRRGTRSVAYFAHGLVGEANGFKGVYPQTGGAVTSASSLAVQAGGGIDVGVSRHIALRLVQADYLRTQLPNSLSNVQNSLRLGVGIVLR